MGKSAAYLADADPVVYGEFSLYVLSVLELESVAPVIGSHRGGETVYLRGRGFTPATTVRFDGVASPLVTHLNGGGLLAVTPVPVWPARQGKRALASRTVDIEIEDGDAHQVLSDAYTYYAR